MLTLDRAGLFPKRLYIRHIGYVLKDATIFALLILFLLSEKSNTGGFCTGMGTHKYVPYKVSALSLNFHFKAH